MDRGGARHREQESLLDALSTQTEQLRPECILEAGLLFVRGIDN